MTRSFALPHRADLAAGALLHILVLAFRTRPGLRQLLRCREGWLDFSVGITTDGGTVARSVWFRSGRVRTQAGIEGVDAALHFRDEAALASLLRAPEEVQHLVLRNRLVPVGNRTWLQLFQFLLGRVLPRSIPPAPSPCTATPPRPATDRLRAPSVDPGVRFLADPYFPDLTLADFPRLERFWSAHLTEPPEICAERALLLTDWYRANGFERRRSGAPWDPVERQGAALRHVLARKEPVIRAGDLLPGTTTRSPTTGSQVFPDAQGTMIWSELDTIRSRAQLPFALSAETAHTLHHDVFGWWAERSFREWARQRHGDPLCAQVDERWVGYFVWKTVGISHTVPDFERALRLGTSGLRAELGAARATSDHEGGVTLDAMDACLQGVELYAARLAEHAAAQQTADPEWAAELAEMAQICRRVPRHPARTLREAVTALWILWVALHNENADTGLSLGRLDQVLQPYLAADLEALETEAERDAAIRRAIELCGCLFLRCADHFPLTPDLANSVFGGASSTQAITLGGVTRDGADAVNDMSYVLLQVTEMLGIRDVNANARVCTGTTSDAWLRRLCDVNLHAAGTPAMHSDDAVFGALLPHGYALPDVRDWAATGCVEPSLSGSHMAHTGSVLFNLVAPLEMALHDGWHPLMELQVGPHTGGPSSLDTFEAFFAAYAEQLRALIALAVERNNQLAAIHADYRPTPLLSALMRGPARKGRDVTRGGAEHNSSGTANIGLADVTDAMLCIEQLVYRDPQLTLAELVAALANDFADAPAVAALARTRVPRFGSGSEHAVAMANRVAKLVHDSWAAHRNLRGGPYTSGFWSMSQHVAYGNLSGALPSRRASRPFTPGLTPEPAASRTFLDAIGDVAGLHPENLDNNIAFNVRLVPRPGADRGSTVGTMAAYIGAYFAQGGMQIQFNVVMAETLRDAMANPDAHRGLLVRISGYNAYFVTLDPEVQRELIERAEFAL